MTRSLFVCPVLRLFFLGFSLLSVALFSNQLAGQTAPNITSVSPGSGAIGASVTISGANFGSSPDTVIFNGVAATPISWSDSSVVVSIPVGATTGNLVVTVAGVASNGVSFTVVPNITGMTPTSGTFGTLVTIQGTSFGATQGSSSVTFNGTDVTLTTWSDTTIIAVVPSGATTGNVAVRVNGVSAIGPTFSVSAPTITSVSPTSGVPGTQVTISGSGFGAAQGNGRETFRQFWSKRFVGENKRF